LSTTRVLLVDDSPAIRAAAARLLAPWFDVIGALSDGQAAVEAFAKLAPDVVVMDISMPVLNGIEAARILRKTHPAAKVIFFTVDGSADLQHVAMETGALGYVLKKRMSADLVEAIKLAMVGSKFVSPSS
jgi:DNA-binding NarL/FixJ family response regulator